VYSALYGIATVHTQYTNRMNTHCRLLVTDSSSCR